jgi:hypothetical protein
MFGSCPYLMSRAPEAEEWIEHGKVLHVANGKERETTQTLTFAGFPGEMRIEEREAEVAHLDKAALDVVLDDGRIVALAPADVRLAAADGERVVLAWGDGIDLGFALPDGIARVRVVQSRLTLTGWYERYTDLLAASDRAPPWQRRPPMCRAVDRRT